MTGDFTRKIWSFMSIVDEYLGKVGEGNLDQQEWRVGEWQGNKWNNPIWRNHDQSQVDAVFLPGLAVHFAHRYGDVSKSWRWQGGKPWGNLNQRWKNWEPVKRYYMGQPHVFPMEFFSRSQIWRGRILYINSLAVLNYWNPPLTLW